MVEQNNEFLIKKNHETRPIGFAPFLEVNPATIDICFHGRDNDFEHDHKGNFKDTFYHQKWNNNVKKEGNVKIMTNKMRI